MGEGQKEREERVKGWRERERGRKGDGGVEDFEINVNAFKFNLRAMKNHWKCLIRRSTDHI